jgi:hypothetical protein
MERRPAQLTHPSVVVKGEIVEGCPGDVSEAKSPDSVLDEYFIRSQANMSAAHRHCLEKSISVLG